MEKHEIRRRIKSLRTMMSEPEKADAALAVFEQLEKSAPFLLAENILIYHALPDELPTQDFLAKWGHIKHFFLPRVNGVNLDILPYDQSRLALGAFHIEEPTGDDCADIEDIELIIVPAVAYDRKGNRLGRGKGYYDRLLSDCAATKVGVGYDFQLYDELPTEEHDIPMNMVVTQSETIVIKVKK